MDKKMIGSVALGIFIGVIALWVLYIVVGDHLKVNQIENLILSSQQKASQSQQLTPQK